MTSKIFSFLKLHQGSVIPSVRIARFLSEQLRLPVVTDQTISDEKLDVLVLVNGAFAFCNCLQELSGAVENARRVVWVQNDYTIIMPKAESGAESPFRKAFRIRRDRSLPAPDFWTTCEKESKSTTLSTYVNWNCLSMDNASDSVVRSRRAEATEDLLYYGSYRAQRVRYFDNYFRGPKCPVTVSSPSKKFDRYRGPKLVIEPKIEGNFYQYLGTKGAGLYLEDKASHSEFHSPANRFYEMISAGLPMIFQPECGGSLRRGGYDTTMYQAPNPLTVSRLMERREEIGKEQRDLWLAAAQAERTSLPARVQAAWAKVTDEI